MQLLGVAKTLAEQLGRKRTRESKVCSIGRLPLGIGMDMCVVLAECHQAWVGQSNKMKDKFVQHLCKRLENMETLIYSFPARNETKEE